MSTEGFNVDVRELINVVKSGNVELFLEYYLNLKNLINPSNGLSLLHEAVRAGDLNKVRYLVDEGAYILGTDGDGLTPIEIASILGKWEIVDCFLADGKMNIDYLFPSGETILTRVISRSTERYYSGRGEGIQDFLIRKLDEIELVLNRGANPFLGDPSGLARLTRFFENSSFGRSHLGRVIEKRNSILCRILFPKSYRELVVPDHVDRKDLLLMLMNDVYVPHRILNWVKFNKSTVHAWLSDSTGMSMAEKIFLDSSERNLSTIVVRNLISKKLIVFSEGLSDQVLNQIEFLLSEKPSNLIEAILLNDHFWVGSGIWGRERRELFNMVWTQGKWKADFGRFIKLMAGVYSHYQAAGSGSCTRRVLNLLTHWLIPELEKRKVSSLPNMKDVSCCGIIGFCVRYQEWNPILRLVLNGDVSVEDLNSSCVREGSIRTRERCSGCGDYHIERRSNCKTPLENSLHTRNFEATSLLLKAGADSSVIVQMIRNRSLRLDGFRTIVDSLDSFPIAWSDLTIDYRFALPGSVLKSIDAKDSSAFGLVTRTEPILGDDLQEIDSDRLVIVNHVPWDIENLVQYITKITLGENKFDTRHPLAGRPIWTGNGSHSSNGYESDELGCLYHLSIPIPQESRYLMADTRRSDLEDLNDRNNADNEENMRLRLGLRRQERLPRTYGEILKSYMEVGNLLRDVERSDFEELYRIGSILWARGEPWDSAIREKLTSEEYESWKNHYKRSLGFEEMPYSLPRGMSKKLLDLKMTQLANLDVWFQKMKSEKVRALEAISNICVRDSMRLSTYIEQVLTANLCVMSFGSLICKGFLKSKTTWDRLDGI